MEERVLQARINAIEATKFTQIPGPNPLLRPGKPGSWDDGMCEMCDILKDNGKYYLYYHATGDGMSYRIGVAVADHPLGPFIKHGDAPILDLSFGDGSDRYIACGSILKEGTDKYYLFYSLQQKSDELNYYIGLAMADNPLGPFKKFEGNPIMKNFGYVGGVTKCGGKYYMFNEYPTRVQAVDYGHISMAVADRPEGPWEPCKDAPVMSVEDFGTWDDAGYSESNVKYDGTMFHMFYGGAKTHRERLRSQESMGYAYSIDGRRFYKYGKNPVAHRENIAFGAAMAECCFLAEYPYIYVYHTLRYTEPWMPESEAAENAKHPAMEHIGVEVLSVADRFTVSYPVYGIAELMPHKVASDPGKLPLSVMNADKFSLTVSCRSDAPSALLVHLRAGTDPHLMDTEDTYCFAVSCEGGTEKRRTFAGDLCTRFLQISVENCGENKISDIDLHITLKG